MHSIIWVNALDVKIGSSLGKLAKIYKKLELGESILGISKNVNSGTIHFYPILSTYGLTNLDHSSFEGW